jgi:hypothetical protein
MSLVLDAGAFVAVERDDREIVALLKRELRARRVPFTHGGVVAQVWRSGSGRQANLARVLAAVEVVPLDDALGRRAGVLLGRARKTDAVDATVVLLAADGDTILTSDPDDLKALAASAAVHVDIVRI